MTILIAIIGIPAATCWCQVTDRAQYLLLKNGQLIGGRVSLYGDRYLVAVPHGEIQVRRADVDHIVGSPQQAYLHRKNAIRFGDAGEHLQLAQWCLDQGLITEAEAQLDAAVGLQPHHPRVPLIERQLRLKSMPRKAAKAVIATQQPVTSADQLDGLVRGMPPGTVETFTKTIQPLLVNSCSARACHGSAAENEFRIWRYPRGRLAPQRVTLRNLEAALRWVDQREPGSSRLLRAAAESHGAGRRSAVLRGIPYQHLVTWVEQIAGAPLVAPRDTSVVNGAAVPAADTSLPPATSHHATRFGAVFFRQDRKSLHNPAQPRMTAPSGDPSRKIHAEFGSDDGGGRAAGAVFRPVDPFDAEVFNRRYHDSTELPSKQPGVDRGEAADTESDS